VSGGDKKFVAKHDNDTERSAGTGHRGCGILYDRGEQSAVRERAQFAVATVSVGSLALGHALLTWPGRAVLALFGGGAVVAFVAEAAVVQLGWLEHHIGPKLVGVPLYVLFGWTGVIYVALRTVLFVTSGWPAVIATAVLATIYDILTDHRGVEDGYWTYTDDLPGPRYRSVPWWNFTGWLLISTATAGLALSAL
jgi:hypothetical protein